MLNSVDKGYRPRVLFVGAFPPPESEIFGGNVTACRALMSSSLPERADLILLDSTQISNPPPRLPVRLLLAVRRFWSFLVQFERQRPDVVLLFASVGASMVEKGVMAWYSRLRSKPALLFPRGGVVIDQCRTSSLTRFWVRAALSGAQMVLCQGPAWQRFVVDLLDCDVEDAPIITNWTATPALLSIGRYRSFNLGDRPVRLLFLGWLEQKKGVFELIEACSHLSESREFELDFVGEGSASKAARELVSQSGLEDVVRFRGWLKGAAVERALSEADVLVLPSWAEGLPNAMIEAMAAKLAVIVSAVGNIPDVVNDDCEVLLIPPKNVPALQVALIRVIDDSVLRQRLGETAFVLAEKQWGVEAVVEEFMAAFWSADHHINRS